MRPRLNFTPKTPSTFTVSSIAGRSISLTKALENNIFLNFVNAPSLIPIGTNWKLATVIGPKMLLHSNPKTQIVGQLRESWPKKISQTKSSEDRFNIKLKKF